MNNSASLSKEIQEILKILEDLEKISQWQKAYWKRVIDRESINNLRT